MSAEPSEARCIRLHERLQQASGLIDSVRDELPRGAVLRDELEELRRRVWEIGYELVDHLDDRGEGA